MTQPVLQKRSFLIAVMAAVQALVPAAVAVGALYAEIEWFHLAFYPSSTSAVIAAVLCLVLVQPPREVTTQLTSARLNAVVDVLFRWFLLLGVLLAVGYVTKSLGGVPAQNFYHLGARHSHCC